MTRDRCMEKLEAIIQRVESGASPVQIREVYVFGSFSRGAMEPNDLDLLVIHDEPGSDLCPLPRDVMDKYSYEDFQDLIRRRERVESVIRKVFRRGRDRIDVILDTDYQAVADRLSTTVAFCSR